jgi:hypothetical protein
MIAVSQVPIPGGSFIEKSLSGTDYADSFSCQFISDTPVRLDCVVRYFLNKSPRWINGLIKIRNLLVKPFGLKTDFEHRPIINISKGGTVAFFEVMEMNDDEVLLFAEDKHLEAYLSIIISKVLNRYEFTVSTTVLFRNIFGHVYFFFIKPFHVLIIKSMIINTANHFSNQ